MGPTAASLLVAAIEFRPACDLLALTVLVYTLLFFIFNGGSDIFQTEASASHEKDIGAGDDFIASDKLRDEENF